MTLRVYADTNSVGWPSKTSPTRSLPGDTIYWCLRIGGQLLDDVVEPLGIRDGDSAVIYYEDSEEEFEWDGRLWNEPIGPGRAAKWIAIVDEATFRRLR